LFRDKLDALLNNFTAVLRKNIPKGQQKQAAAKEPHLTLHQIEKTHVATNPEVDDRLFQNLTETDL
jgi:hypothetical protein